MEKKMKDLEFLRKEVFFRIQVFSVCLCGARETRDECLILWQQSAMLWGCVTLGEVRTVTGNINAK